MILKLLELAQELDNTEKPIECSMIVNDMQKVVDREVSKQLTIPVVSKRYDEMTFKPPFRVGRKQGKAVLDANGLLVTFFEKSEEQALLFCDYLNNVC